MEDPRTITEEDSDCSIEPLDITDELLIEQPLPAPAPEAVKVKRKYTKRVKSGDLAPENVPVPEVKPKRKYVKKTVQEKADAEIIVKHAIKVPITKKTKPKTERIVYIVQDPATGVIEEVERPAAKMTRKQMKQIEVEELAVKKEVQAGKRLTRKVNGAVDDRTKPTRTIAQIAATSKMVEANRLRRLANAAEKQNELQAGVKDSVKEIMAEIVTNPKILKHAPSKPIQIPKSKYDRMGEYL